MFLCSADCFVADCRRVRLHGSWIARVPLKSRSSILISYNRKPFRSILKVRWRSITIKPPLSCEESRKQLQLAALNKPQKGIKKKTGSDFSLAAAKEI